MKKLKFEQIDSKNKKIKIIIAVIAVAILLGVIYMISRTHSVDSDNTFANQYVDGLSFENAKIEYKEGISTFIVEVYNESKDVMELKKIEIFITDSEDIEHRLVGYIGDELEVDDARFIKASIDKEIKNIKKIRYVVNK